MNGYKKYLKSLVANYKMKFVRLFAELYKDDRQVTKLLVVKRYSERPRVEVRVKRDTGELE